MPVHYVEQLLGDFGKDRTNVWSWDFRNALRMDSSAYYQCRNGCSTTLPLEARQVISGKTCWANARWLVAE